MAREDELQALTTAWADLRKHIAMYGEGDLRTSTKRTSFVLTQDLFIIKWGLFG